MMNISFTTEQNLCCGCGVCVGVCPKKCISWKRSANGMYQPIIDQDLCVKCGICMKVCPGLGHQHKDNSDQDAVRGKVISAYNAWSINPQIRHISASGGVISSIVKQLLEDGRYDVAFMVDTYDYRHQLVTMPVTVNDIRNVVSSSYPKSRYLPVSHENAVIYAKNNREKKVIIIGTSCAIRGFLAAIKQLHLKRENYLLLGLFCDSIFSYNVIDYFSQSSFCGERELEKLHFKNKESGGWPGNMKFFFSDGSTEYQDKSERAKVKDYFRPERCLYCIDKLNVCADISFGDNYTEQDSSGQGSNSVIVRTELGSTIWNEVISVLEYREVTINQIMKAQHVNWRLNHFCYGRLKERDIEKKTGLFIALNAGVNTNRVIMEYRERWKTQLQMLRAGETYREQPKNLKKQMLKMDKAKKQGVIRKFVSKGYHFIKRRISHIIRGEEL